MVFNILSQVFNFCHLGFKVTHCTYFAKVYPAPSSSHVINVLERFGSIQFFKAHKFHCTKCDKDFLLGTMLPGTMEPVQVDIAVLYLYQ